MKWSMISVILVGLCGGCATRQVATSQPAAVAEAAPKDDLRTLTLQYRTMWDAVASSKFVAIYPNGMTMGLKIHWKIGDEKKRQLDAVIAQLEKDRLNAKEFTARGEWIHNGFELVVYEIEKNFQLKTPATGDDP